MIFITINWLAQLTHEHEIYDKWRYSNRGDNVVFCVCQSVTIWNLFRRESHLDCSAADTRHKCHHLMTRNLPLFLLLFQNLHTYSLIYSFVNKKQAEKPIVLSKSLRFRFCPVKFFCICSAIPYMEVPSGFIAKLWSFISFLPFFLLLFTLGLLKGNSSCSFL